MQTSLSSRVRALGLKLPASNPPRGAYVPSVVVDNLLFIAGQAPRLDGILKFKGKVGVDLTIDEGREAARICALNILSHLGAAIDDDLGRCLGAVRIAGIVNCREEFDAHPSVLDGASELLTAVLGDKGQHVRIATGASSLPSQMAVEVEAIFKIRV